MKGLLGTLYGNPFTSAGLGLLSSNFPSAVRQNPYDTITRNLEYGQQLKQKAITEERESKRWEWELEKQRQEKAQRAAVSAYLRGNQPQVYPTVEDQPAQSLPPVNVDEYDRPLVSTDLTQDLYTEDFPLLTTPEDRAVYVNPPEVDATAPQALAWENVDEYGRPLVDAPVPQVDATVLPTQLLDSRGPPTVEDQLLSDQPSTQLLDSRVPPIDSSVLTKYKEAVDRGPGQQTAQPTTLQVPQGTYSSKLDSAIEQWQNKIDTYPYVDIETYNKDQETLLRLRKDRSDYNLKQRELEKTNKSNAQQVAEYLYPGDEVRQRNYVMATENVVNTPEGEVVLNLAQQKADEKFGGSYVEDLTKAVHAAASISKIKESIGLLQAHIDGNKPGGTKTKDLTGGVITNFASDFLAARAGYQDSVVARENVTSVTMLSLKAILGGQFAEDEAKRLIALAYNPALSEEVNLVRITRLKNSLVAALKLKNDLLDYYEKWGTIAKFGRRTTTLNDRKLTYFENALGDPSFDTPPTRTYNTATKEFK